MDIRLLLPAKVKNGQLLWTDPVKTSKVMSKYEGKEVVVTISRPQNQRSLNQNAYYWKVIIEILTDTLGYEREETHEVLRGKFLLDWKTVAGESIQFSHSTTELSTIEFEDYLQKIREWASVKLNIFIPLPNEVSIK
jgi:hypothetical protein